ncbi:MAG TPA: phosphoribosylpyrophosphate synthetase [Salinimicrobium sp.]|nr:phosphoribosylpyrophosphate synthetase [Salinimicrobium sp.]
MKKGTLSEVINRLRTEDGYSEDFNLLDEHIELKSVRERFNPDEFHVDEVYRFEGISNPDDNSILYAIHTNSGRKGVLVDGYGISGGQVSEEMMKKLDLKEDRDRK